MMRSVIKINGLLLFTFLINAQYGNTNSLESEKRSRSVQAKTISPIKDTLPIVKVLSIEKENTRIASTGEDLGKQCDTWQLDKPTIEKIFKASKQISGEEHHYLYDVWPCNMKGKILINRDTFSFEVNPGSYVVIWKSDKQLYYGCTNKKFEKYFLSKVWDPKKGYSPFFIIFIILLIVVLFAQIHTPVFIKLPEVRIT